LRNMFSYAFASAGLVQPCQIRATMCRYDGRARPPGAPFCDSIANKSMSKSKNRSWSHAHDLIAAIDINDLTRDRRRAIAGEKDSGLAELRRVATAFQRRALMIMF